jgi:hypothetical protein
MKWFLFRVLGVGLPLAVVGSVACSSSSAPITTLDSGHPPPVDTGPPPCVQANCLKGNQCLADEAGVESCQLPCTAQSDCPWDYTCSAVTSTSTYCTADTAVSPTTGKAYVEGTGVWGDSCSPAGGVDNNPACDWAQGFRCYAQSPTDGAAFCTQIYCKTDSDCKGGWGCATVNLAPNAESVNRSDGQTYTVCKPRDQCAECQSDIDCASSTGVPEHCILDRQGSHYCATTCETDNNCTLDAQCVNLGQSALCTKTNGPCVCAPYARECYGDGLLCAPCRSDADCKAGGGLCLLADYSTEHFCGVPSKIPCTINSSDELVAMCPMTDEAPNGHTPLPASAGSSTPLISCLTGPDGVEDPANQCVGLVVFGEDEGMPIPVIGCWTANRPNG